MLSFNSQAQYACGEIDGFEFSNGNDSLEIMDGGEYDLNNLPSNFYIDLNVHGNSQSAKYVVTNLGTGQNYTIVENEISNLFLSVSTPSWNPKLKKFKILLVYNSGKLYWFI